MPFKNWQAALQPKVQGSWNLHEILPANMDFFVMLSSVAGIFGNRGQSNYAAGNTFQDALAAYRTSLGMKATSIDLGSVSNVGWVAENIESKQNHTDTLFQFLREEEVHKTIEFMIDDRRKKQDPSGCFPRSQIVLGLPTGEMCRQNNIPKPAYLDYPLFTHMRTVDSVGSVEKVNENTISTSAQIRATSNLSDTISVVSQGIIERLSSLLALPSSEINPLKFSFSTIDSLVSMEFVSWIVKELKAEVSLLDVMGAQNIQALGQKIAQTTKLTNYSK